MCSTYEIQKIDAEQVDALIEAIGAKPYKTYRIYEKPLA